MRLSDLPLLAALALTALSLAACHRAADDLEAPALHAPVVRAALEAPGLHWTSAETQRFHLHALADTQAAGRFPELGRSAEAAYRANLALLGEPDDASRTELLFISTREEMARIVGQPANGYALPEENAVVFRYAPGRTPALQHELMHVISWRRWGAPSRYWLSEGLATYAAGSCAGYDLHALAAAIRREGRFVPFSVLDTRFWSADDVVTYLESASLVRYLHEQYGTAAVKALWQQGSDAALNATGRSMSEVEAAWLTLLDETAPASAGWETSIRTGGCE